eukprot:CAMPEP_0172676536 /NCGR_PEP_ID=MMETSP1074-20121228/14056_1 /TAXON_ID=2916 /ORGANISM="Ceratium fusus, Strain PA161109" /LENGTH=247 /DNA_ID=CAMNT_0013494225 /DNA_START=41 /DNA_END=784 /DNA_ORIENTATION=-
MEFRKGMGSATWDRKEPSPTRRVVSIQDPSIQDLEEKLESERRQKESLQAELTRARAELQASRAGRDHELWAEVMKVRADLEQTRAELMSIDQQVPGDQANNINSVFINNMENPTRVRLKNVQIITEGDSFGNKAATAGQPWSQRHVMDPDADRSPTFQELPWRGEQQSTSKSPLRASPGRWGDAGHNERANAQTYSSWRTTTESKGFGNFEGGNGNGYDTGSTNAGDGDISDVIAKLRRTVGPLRN